MVWLGSVALVWGQGAYFEGYMVYKGCRLSGLSLFGVEVHFSVYYSLGYFDLHVGFVCTYAHTYIFNTCKLKDYVCVPQSLQPFNIY